MESTKGRGGKAETPHESHEEFSNLSSINKVSFLEGLQKNDDKPLHSTALEEDLHVVEEGQVENRNPGRNERSQTARTTTPMHGAAVRRDRPKTCGEIETEEKRSQTIEEGDVSTVNRKLVGKKPARLRGGQKSAVRPVTNKQMKTVRKRSKLISGRSSDSQSQEESESGTKQQKCRKVLSSEEKEHEDTSWAKVSRTRKSSSGTSADAEKTNIPDHRKSRGHRGETDLDLVLAAFLDFCDKYRESVVSKAVKQSIDSFSNNVKEQLLKKISFYKEFRFLKRQNAKVGSLICRKTQRLLDAKNELMRAERQVRLLQTEKAELQLRLADLRLGYTFLHDIRELNTQYLRYRHKHHKENETYGASSKPAMLLEQQQKGINQETEKTEGSWE